MFASPNTLMALLRVVERLWTRDKIQREAGEIAKVGGLVLDSLQNFLADFVFGEEAVVDEVIEGGGVKMALGHPGDGLDVAQSARCILKVGFEIVFREVVLGL